MKLAGAKTLLAGHKKVRDLEPLIQRDFAVLKHGANLDRELRPAFCAGAQAGAGRPAADGIDALRVGVAAVKVDRAVRPTIASSRTTAATSS